MEKIQLQQVLPTEIEKRSFEIITEELKRRGEEDKILPENELVVKRVIHTPPILNTLKISVFLRER